MKKWNPKNNFTQGYNKVNRGKMSTSFNNISDDIEQLDNYNFTENQSFTQPKDNYKMSIRNKLNQKYQGQDNYLNEVMQNELKNLYKENSELKFCINKLNQKFDKELKIIKAENYKKTKELQITKNVIKKKHRIN